MILRQVPNFETKPYEYNGRPQFLKIVHIQLDFKFTHLFFPRVRQKLRNPPACITHQTWGLLRRSIRGTWRVHPIRAIRLSGYPGGRQLAAVFHDAN